MNKIATQDRLSVQINEAAAILGIGRSSVYKLIDAGQLPDIKIAGRRVIPMAALRKLLEVCPV